MRTLLGWVALLGAGCGRTIIGDCFDPGIFATYPFDGQRTWVYAASDPEVGYELVATSAKPVDPGAEVAVYRVPFVKRCIDGAAGCVDGELVQAVSWSSREEGGVAVHEIDAGDGPVGLDPPVVLSGDGPCDHTPITRTVSGGATWTVRRVEDPVCTRPQGCAELQVEVEPGDGAPLAGTWWSEAPNGVVAFQAAGSAVVWTLSDIDCDGSCDGTW